jgi:hypothetical protein
MKVGTAAFGLQEPETRRSAELLPQGPSLQL